jgi:hypothetical protein
MPEPIWPAPRTAIVSIAIIIRLLYVLLIFSIHHYLRKKRKCQLIPGKNEDLSTEKRQRAGKGWLETEKSLVKFRKNVYNRGKRKGAVADGGKT